MTESFGINHILTLANKSIKIIATEVEVYTSVVVDNLSPALCGDGKHVMGDCGHMVGCGGYGGHVSGDGEHVRGGLS